MVIVRGAADSQMGVMVPDGLGSGHVLRKYSCPFIRGKHSEVRVHGYELHPHFGAGIFGTPCIYIDGGLRGDMGHRHS